MAARRSSSDSDRQLDLFAYQTPTYDTADSIRPDGRETLARVPSKDGSRPGSEGPASPDAPGSGREDEGRNGEPAHRVDETGPDTGPSSSASVGDGAREIHSATPRRIVPRREEAPKNLNNYRITEADRLGDGGPKQKFQQNLAAIRTLRRVETEGRPPTNDEKAALVRYVGWGAMPQVFDDFSREWAKQRDALRKELTDEEFEFARSTTLNAHYTSPTVISGMYFTLQRVGFTHGRVLEPA